MARKKSKFGPADAAERKRAERKRKADAGLVRRDVWAHPDDWPAIRRLERQLRRKRLPEQD